MMVGNGGDAGYIRYDEMQVPVNKYGFAVACTVSQNHNVKHFPVLLNYLVTCCRILDTMVIPETEPSH